jgi:hypothetical protein
MRGRLSLERRGKEKKGKGVVKRRSREISLAFHISAFFFGFASFSPPFSTSSFDSVDFVNPREQALDVCYAVTTVED